jgi:hypothetical protein
MGFLNKVLSLFSGNRLLSNNNISFACKDPVREYEQDNCARNLSVSEIRELVNSKNAELIMDTFINSDDVTSIALSIALGMHDEFSCGQGLLLHERTMQSKMVTLANKIGGQGLGSGFQCNMCNYTTNLGVEYLKSRLEKGTLGNPSLQHSGTEKAMASIEQLKKQPIVSKHWMDNFDGPSSSQWREMMRK